MLQFYYASLIRRIVMSDSQMFAAMVIAIVIVALAIGIMA